MIWINFLHFYQPANAEGAVIKEATDKSYLRIVRALEENPKIKFTINITGCLVNRWVELGYLDLINRIKKLIERGQIEITGTAAYHPILPLIDIKEAEKQIIENEEIIKKYFGMKPVGFFFPEMAYGRKVAKLIAGMGYQWLILDEISMTGILGMVDYAKKYIDQNSGLKVVFRKRRQSSDFPPNLIRRDVKKGKFSKLYITATDGELYGLRHIDHTGEFEKILKNEKLETKTISEYLKENKLAKKVRVVNSSWESTEDEIKNKNPYSLWQDRHNDIQSKIWKLAKLAYQTTERYKKTKNYYWGRWHLVRGLASCTFWWASQKDFREVFGPYAWNPDEICKRINEFVKAVRTFEDKTDLETKLKTEKLALNIKEMIWEKHWRMKA